MKVSVENSVLGNVKVPSNFLDEAQNRWVNDRTAEIRARLSVLQKEYDHLSGVAHNPKVFLTELYSLYSKLEATKRELTQKEASLKVDFESGIRF